MKYSSRQGVVSNMVTFLDPKMKAIGKVHCTPVSQSNLLADPRCKVGDLMQYVCVDVDLKL